MDNFWSETIFAINGAFLLLVILVAAGLVPG